MADRGQAETADSRGQDGEGLGLLFDVYCVENSSEQRSEKLKKLLRTLDKFYERVDVGAPAVISTREKCAIMTKIQVNMERAPLLCLCGNYEATSCSC